MKNEIPRLRVSVGVEDPATVVTDQPQLISSIVVHEKT
jgi:hypothetical protein